MSKVLPNMIADRPELNLRQGIKSSLNSWRQLVSSLYLFYLYSEESHETVYSKETTQSGKKVLLLNDNFAEWLSEKWSSIPSVSQRILSSPLYSAQMEALQVGLELFLRLAKISFNDTTLPDAAERTGGARYNKDLRFSTNMKIFADAISSFPGPDRVDFLGKWLQGEDGSVVDVRAKEVLVAFTEECQFKLRTGSDEQLFFQQDGIYDKLRVEGDTVESSDSHEPVGPFRVLKSFVKEGMHPYIEDSPNGFRVRSGVENFESYANMVKASLSLSPKRTVVFEEVDKTITAKTNDSCESRQRIVYGAPGTGKSWRMSLDSADKIVVRTTFHPDSDYSTFVGAYKPLVKRDDFTSVVKEGKAAGGQITTKDKLIVNEKIAYGFRPQAFISAYVAAWKEYAKGDAGKKVVLLIEEINRGDCAQVFGDLFQLLDRDGEYFSSYPIKADADIEEWLSDPKQFGGSGLCLDAPEGLKMDLEEWNRVMKGEMLALPPTMYLWATMNTSDQSLFPVDSAFKRRWDWEYVPILEGKDKNTKTPLGWKIVVGADTAKKEYDWWSFVGKINDVIDELTSSEDKKLGYFFVKPKDKTIDQKLLVNKVFFYLWNDVFKDMVGDPALQIQINGKGRDLKFHDFFNKADGAINVDIVKAFLDKLNVEPPASKQQGGTVPQAVGTAVSV